MRRSRGKVRDQAQPAPDNSRLRAADLFGLAALGLRGRPARTVLSAAGIALGVATMIGVLGVSSSSRSELIAQIDALGTNLLTVEAGQSFTGSPVHLPVEAPAMVRRIGPVLGVASIGNVATGVNVYRNQRISPTNTNGIAVYAAQDSLLTTLQGRVADGQFLNRALDHLPAVVLGASAASALGIDRTSGSAQVWIDHQWFSVVGILDPLELAPDLDRSALVGFPIAEGLLGATGTPAQIYVRAAPATVAAVESVLAATVDPASPQSVSIANPSDALVARADASAAFESLFLALGAVALVVGGVGIANVMILAVLERRGEIGLRRAMGATQTHLGMQFVAESTVLAGIGGVAGVLLGTFTTTVYAMARHWSTVVPLWALVGSVAVALAVGAVAGLYPALRAARLPPSEALRSV